ncbi:hypothetical protein Tco_0294748 [Tanacetum coccineum]
MDAPPTPNHVFNYPEDDPTIDKEEFEEDPHEDPEEEPEEEEPEELNIWTLILVCGTRMRKRMRLSSSSSTRLKDHLTLHLLLPLIIMPPKMMKRKAVKKMVKKRPHKFNGTEGIIRLKHWFEKMEHVFEIRKCAKEDKVKFSVCTFEGRALTWWNRNVQKFGLANANLIPLSNFGLMCLDLVTPEKKKIERYIRGLPERVKANVTSSKPASLHDAINMARELVEQAIQGKATRISKGFMKCSLNVQFVYNPTNNNNHNRNNNTHHQQQNRRQETARAYVAAPTDGRGYAGNLPKCNRHNSHHNG